MHNKSHPITISAIIPNYNGAQWLSKSLQSLVAQTEKFTEIIIIDDASTDESLSIINDFMQRYDYIRLIRHEKNQGVNRTLNQGFEQASGDYVLNGAADDWYDLNLVARAKQVAEKHPQVGLICGDAMVHQHNSTIPFCRMLSFSKKNVFISPKEFKFFLKTDYIGFTGGGQLLNRKAVLSAGKLHSEAAWYADWLLYFVLAFHHGLYYIDKIFIHTVKREESYSASRQIWEKEKPALFSLIKILRAHYPELWQYFRSAALLPHYELRYLPFFLFSSQLRPYFTLRLLWRSLLTNKLIVKFSKLFPYEVVLKVRKLLRA